VVQAVSAGRQGWPAPLGSPAASLDALRPADESAGRVPGGQPGTEGSEVNERRPSGRCWCLLTSPPWRPRYWWPLPSCSLRELSSGTRCAAVRTKLSAKKQTIPGLIRREPVFRMHLTGGHHRVPALTTAMTVIEIGSPDYPL